IILQRKEVPAVKFLEVTYGRSFVIAAMGACSLSYYFLLIIILSVSLGGTSSAKSSLEKFIDEQFHKRHSPASQYGTRPGGNRVFEHHCLHSSIPGWTSQNYPSIEKLNTNVTISEKRNVAQSSWSPIR